MVDMSPGAAPRVVFVVGLLVLAGGALGWHWVHHRPWAAGQARAATSFIEHWVSRLLYWEVPWWRLWPGGIAMARKERRRASPRSCTFYRTE